MSEATLMRQIQLRASEMGARIFRNNIGFCRCRGRKIRYGVGGKGWPDTIGWVRVTITPEMVGRTIAQFMGVEIKRPEKSHTSDDQRQALIGIIRNGGIGIVAHSVQEFEEAYYNQTSTVK